MKRKLLVAAFGVFMLCAGFILSEIGKQRVYNGIACRSGKLYLVWNWKHRPKTKYAEKILASDGKHQRCRVQVGKIHRL